jgi:hypothetical protein
MQKQHTAIILAQVTATDGVTVPASGLSSATQGTF